MPMWPWRGPMSRKKSGSYAYEKRKVLSMPHAWGAARDVHVPARSGVGGTLMTASRRRQGIDQAQATQPGPDDPVIAALRLAESHYLALYQSLEQEASAAREDLAHARADAERLSNALANARA